MMADPVAAVIETRALEIGGSPFRRWHFSTKYVCVQRLLSRYLTPGCKFLDVACGDGDGMYLARATVPDAELWGIDIVKEGIEKARTRLPEAKLFVGDIMSQEYLPAGYFDVVYEFGGSFLIKDWEGMIRQYLRLTKDGGVILWELSQRWSMAHLMFLFTAAPKLREEETTLQRLVRSLSPSKFSFYDDGHIAKCLNNSGFAHEVVEHVPIWYFYCQGFIRLLLDFLHPLTGDRLFTMCEGLNRYLLPRFSGFFIVIRKKHEKGPGHENHEIHPTNIGGILS